MKREMRIGRRNEKECEKLSWKEKLGDEMRKISRGNENFGEKKKNKGMRREISR